MRDSTAAVGGGGVPGEDDAWYAMLSTLKLRFHIDSALPSAVISIQAQGLYLYGPAGREYAYPVSTSRYGSGNRQDSLKTPLGPHRIAARIGAGAPIGRVFRARQPSQEIAGIITAAVSSQQDLITTRILRLAGLQPGVNRGEGIDSYERYIYIHGTPDEGLIGRPVSHGCVRMTNADVIDLFDRLQENALVLIV